MAKFINLNDDILINLDLVKHISKADCGTVLEFIDGKYYTTSMPISKVRPLVVRCQGIVPYAVE